ncbi:MAG TPA: hypothetical protein P5268_01875 [Candidatus Marinimicrobia bacterium]|nr:hypothetical protein [Candidatus Neomarinimicrobiota bacterium]HRS50895.1 hypothetical protein [Candidatus Neomarinimicrobiota bacterium]HRU91763.1 hypothetical protein [Candidatus Neomarinimicrobiota bacterium]
MRKISLVEMCILIALLSSCKKVAVQSVWNDGNIKIDAVVKDWGSHLVFDDKSKVSLGVANDSENLYLCWVTSDPDLHRQILMNGLIVEVDQKGSKSHHFGIKFPLGSGKQGNSPLMPPDDRPKPGSFEPSQKGNNFLAKFNEQQTEFILLGPDDEQETLVPLKNDLGLEIQIGFERQQLIYELKLPFTVISQHLGVDQITNNKPLLVIFKTEKVEMPFGHPDDMMGGPGGMGRPEGGMGGPGGRMGVPDRGMDRPDTESSSRQAFSYKISVTLAVNK